MLAKGFAATSIDELIAAAGISKSGFFYHFKDKGELAKGLMLRYLAQDREVLENIFRRGDELNEDPLHGFLVGLKLFAEMLADLPEAHPGCLAASFAYQDQLFNARGPQAQCRRHAGLASAASGNGFALIAERYPPRPPSRSRCARRHGCTLVEGGLILGRVLRDATIVPAAGAVVPRFRATDLHAGAGLNPTRCIDSPALAHTLNTVPRGAPVWGLRKTL